MPGLRVRKRSKRGLPDQLPDLTLPARGFGRDPESAEDDIEAEYHGVYTVRGAKIRPHMFVEAWLYDPKMDEHYTRASSTCACSLQTAVASTVIEMQPHTSTPNAGTET